MIASGTVGSCKWEISDAGALRIYPTNGTSGSFSQNAHPWLDYASSIKTGKVESGVSVTSDYTLSRGMFEGCSSLTSLDLSGLNTSAVTKMYSMFYGCSSLTSLDLSSFNTSAVTNMSSMFSGCSSLTSLDLSGLNTSAVTNMSMMFNGCSSLTSLDLSSFNTSAVTYMGSMFYGCSLLTAVIIGNSFDMSAVGSNYEYKLCMGKARNTSQSIVVTSDDDFYALTTAQRAGTWNRNVTATYKVTAARSTSETATTFGVTWATDAATTTRRLRIYKKLASASDYESTPSIDDSTTLAGRSSGNDTFTISGLSEESYDFKVELYDGTNTFLAFPSIQSVVRVADFDYSTQKLKVYGGLEVGSVDYTITDAEYQELVNLLGGGLTYRLIDWIYPVGHIIESTNADFNPNTLYVGTTWEKIEGRFTLGSSSDYALGSTGGEVTHIITKNEMPSHNHQLTPGGYKVYGGTSGPDRPAKSSTGYGESGLYTGNTGDNQPHNNMPPYLVVNKWVRTA